MDKIGFLVKDYPVPGLDTQDLMLSFQQPCMREGLFPRQTENQKLKEAGSLD